MNSIHGSCSPTVLNEGPALYFERAGHSPRSERPSENDAREKQQEDGLTSNRIVVFQ